MIRALAVLLLLAAPAAARVVEGAIVAQDGAGAFVLLPEPPFAVGEDMIDRPDLIAFDEAQGVLLEAPLVLDTGVVPAGSVVALHHVLFDGTGGRHIGWVLFDAPILGLATTPETLAATDALSGVETLFLGHDLRGLEPRDRAWIDPADPRRLWVDWAGSSPGDHLRVVTEAAPLM
ncbi:hypothetical protein [Roseicyclus persicicus]|uniref:Uncharacterized protein n=1 Tax=Roseicyclus persicicus TaxID=2650661 RepID=A0A7X6H2B3_9RHOB|nr:hypothetical protein [Roseibacterium persicicum]NKX45521.1 hypothetical protein [Roseibacterium persicicum]